MVTCGGHLRAPDVADEDEAEKQPIWHKKSMGLLGGVDMRPLSSDSSKLPTKAPYSSVPCEFRRPAGCGGGWSLAESVLAAVTIEIGGDVIRCPRALFSEGATLSSILRSFAID